MRWDYAIAMGASVICAPVSYFLAYIGNPISLVFLNVAAPLVRLLGRDPATQGFSSMGSIGMISLLWPLVIVPLHYANYEVLKWSHWGFTGLVVLVGIAIALGVLVYTSTPLA